jgi:hypothetical protein
MPADVGYREFSPHLFHQFEKDQAIVSRAACGV